MASAATLPPAAVGGKRHSAQQFICVVAFLTIFLTHFMGSIQPGLAASSSSQQAGESAASTQPLWSYQVKPTNYVGAAQTQAHQQSPYAGLGPSSLFDAFTGLSQRQGALTSSPFMSILPIILIAAGGLLLLLPMLTMMMASPFGGGAFGGGYQNYGGYPQVGALNKRRSLDQMMGGGHRGIIELFEHVSSTIEDISRKYSGEGSAQQAAGAQQPNKRSKGLNSSSSSGGSVSSNSLPSNHQQAGPNEHAAAAATNHRSAQEATNSANSVSNLVGL